MHGATHPKAPPSHTARFYSVDVGLVHFVALDLNVYYFTTEGVWAAAQLSWLAWRSLDSSAALFLSN